MVVNKQKASNNTRTVLIAHSFTSGYEPKKAPELDLPKLSKAFNLYKSVPSYTVFFANTKKSI